MIKFIRVTSFFLMLMIQQLLKAEVTIIQSPNKDKDKDGQG